MPEKGHRLGDEGYRSWVMSRIRSKDTKPEMVVRRLLHGLGYRSKLDSGGSTVGPMVPAAASR